MAWQTSVHFRMASVPHAGRGCEPGAHVQSFRLVIGSADLMSISWHTPCLVNGDNANLPLFAFAC